MHYDPLRPTVAGLLAARRTSAFLRTLPVSAPGAEGLLVEALSSCLRPGSAIIRRPVIDTPVGTVWALLAVVAAGRRIAVVDAAEGEKEAALALVFGTYDAIHVVSDDALARNTPCVAAWIVAHETRLFTPSGRDALRLCASTVRPGSVGTPVADREARRLHEREVASPATAIRLNRPSEWAEALEDALRPVERERLFARTG